MSDYDVFKYLHVSFAVAWVGGALFFNVLAARVQAAGTVPELARMGEHIHWLGTRYFTPLSLLVLASGAAMVADAWSFGDTWVMLGLAGIVLTIITGAAFLGPQAGKIRGLVEQHGADSEPVRAHVTRLVAVARIDIVVLFLVIAAMVIKPGT